jgi:hypothetical protein
MIKVPVPTELITVPIHESIQYTWWFVTSQPITTLYIIFYISMVCMTVAVPDKEKKHAKA